MEVSSGIIGAVGLTLQLGKSIKDLCDFIDLIKDAPQDLAVLNQELKAIHLILKCTTYATECDKHQVVMDHLLEGFKEPLGALQQIVEEITCGLGSKNKLRRQWTKVEWTWKVELVAKLKGRLLDAKVNIILAQSFLLIKTLSLPQLHRPSSVTSGSQAPVSLATIPHQTRSFSSIGQDGSIVFRSLSSEVLRELESSSLLKSKDAQLNIKLPQARPVEKDTAIQPASIQRLRQQLAPKRVVYGFKSTSSFSKRRRLQVEKSSSFTARTLFAAIHYSSATYEVTRKRVIHADDDDTSSSSTTSLETERTFKFVPRLWVTRLFINQIIQMTMLDNWLPTNIRVYKLIPSSSLIFELCRRGFTDAVSVMLTRGEASIRDINEYGETLLHAAASFCRYDLCDFLLTEGADPSLIQIRDRNSTPFDRACSPGEWDIDGSKWTRSVPYDDLMNTLRLFVRYGEDLDGLSWFFALTEYEMRNAKDTNTTLPSRWILEDILPSLDPYSHDSRWWQSFLLAAIRASMMHQSLLKILRSCDTAAVRVNLIYWIFMLKKEQYTDIADGRQEEFDALVYHSGGLSFIQNCFGKLYSPLSAALENRNSFVNFRALLKNSPWNLQDLIRSELLLWPSGWTEGWSEETLERLFAHDFERLADFPHKSCEAGDHSANALHVDWDYPFEKTVRRIKHNTKLDDRLDDTEIEHQMAWDEAVRCFEGDICYGCFSKKNLVKWSFLTCDEMNFDEDITIYKPVHKGEVGSQDKGARDTFSA